MLAAVPLGAFAATSDQVTSLPLARMTLEQKVGQTMIWSFTGRELGPATLQTLTKYQPGAIIFFRQNIASLSQVARLNEGMQKIAAAKMAAPLFTMIDQEGGLVTRIRTATPLPSALALSRMEDPAFVRAFARRSAELLKGLGFNVNLAPVLDVSDPSRHSFIGNRTFGDDPDRVAEMTDAFAMGVADAGLLPTAKHFPGHGDTSQNSHVETPRRLATREQLEARDLIPFEDFANVDAPRAVMMAHLAMPNIDPSGLPATFSSVMIGRELRENLGYRGLVITDDLEMNGAAISADVGERAVRAFLAGNDMLMLAGSSLHQREAYRAVLEAARSGRISRARLDESVGRILATKAKLPSAPRYDSTLVAETLKTLDRMSREVLKRNFTLAAQKARHAWPTYRSSRPVSVLSGSSMFFRKFRSRYPGSARFKWLTRASLREVARDLTARDEYAIYFASGQISARWLNALPRTQKAKFIVVNCNEPAEIADQEAFLSVFNVNSYFTDGALWLGEMLARPVDVRAPAAAPRPHPQTPF